MPFNDETLMALADGELSPELAREVAAEVKRNPDLAARLHRFTDTRHQLAQAARAAPEPIIDPALIAQIRAASMTQAAQNGWRVRLSGLPRAANLNLRPLAAAAAAFALALVAVGWYGLQPDQQGDIAPAALASLLDGLPSGGKRALDGGGELVMISSYRNNAGELCREYEVYDAVKGQVQISCHDGESSWSARFTQAIGADGEGYLPASGGSEALDRFLHESGAGAPMTLEEELSALSALAAAPK